MGLGGTLPSNAFAAAALRAMLEHAMTESAYEHLVHFAKVFSEFADELNG